MLSFKTSWPFHQGQDFLSVREREDGKKENQVLTSWQACLSFQSIIGLPVFFSIVQFRYCGIKEVKPGCVYGRFL